MLLVLKFIWKISSLIIAAILAFELVVISPFLLILYLIYRFSIYIAPDVFTIKSFLSATKSANRKILLCVDPTSLASINWITHDFLTKDQDHVIVVHVIEPTESIQIPGESVCFNKLDIDRKDFFIPQYMSEFCHWLGRNQISFDGLLVRPFRNCSVSETLLRLAKNRSVDCIVASASERTGT